MLAATDDRFVVSTGRHVHATLDVDLSDPSLVPGTGTSEPGGGNWRRAADLLKSVLRERIVVGAGVVDPAPDRGEEASVLAAAGAAYGTTTGR